MADETDRKRTGVRANNSLSETGSRVSRAQLDYLSGGLDQPGGRLPLFDYEGRKIDPDTIRACLREGYCAAWFANPMKPDWMVCRLTEKGRRLFR